MSLTKEELRELVEKEVASSAAREVLAELGPKQESFSKLLRHPLLLALIATVIGWSYDGVVKEREAKKLAAEIEITEADRREDSAIAKLNEFVALAHTRSIATDLLRSALKREAGVEAVEKKRTYYAAYSDWNVKQPANLQQLRQLIVQSREDLSKRSIYEIAVEASISSLFRSADACITNAYDTARKIDFGDISDVKIPSCGDGVWHLAARQQAFDARLCAFAILSNMSGQIRGYNQRRREVAMGLPIDRPDDPSDLAERVEAELRNSCPGM